MKKSFISVAVASVLAVASVSAMAAPSFYGRLDLAATHADKGFTTQSGDSGYGFESNFSHLGVKGSESLAAGYDVIYQMEFGVNNTNGDAKNAITARNTFLGLKTNYGTALVGRNDSVFKQSLGGLDMFASTNAAIDRLVAGQGRQGDGLWYYSPKIANLVTVNGTFVAKSNQSAESQDNTRGQQYALDVTLGDKALKQQNFYAAAAYMHDIDSTEAYRILGQVKLADFKLGGMFQNTKSQAFTNLKGNSYYINLGYNLNGVNLKLGYGMDESGLGKYFQNAVESQQATNGSFSPAAISDVNVENINIGADYRLAKSTMVYGQFAHYTGDYKVSSVKQDLSDDNVISFGVRYDF